jgi:hypothetical protein
MDLTNSKIRHYQFIFSASVTLREEKKYVSTLFYIIPLGRSGCQQQALAYNISALTTAVKS